MLLLLSLLSQTLSSNMNGDIYGISNPDQNSKTQFSTVYSDINPWNTTIDNIELISYAFISTFGSTYLRFRIRIRFSLLLLNIQVNSSPF